ncbi:DUF3168 domain-containing protein [Palleronia caenipelagi]|uniref:DUF3168 domain-containing protein n=1 Tax=Palleronia caenipelagi TaxID=2489174 RepID=A0A547Q037_9RHOB|nr:DUF3168 domain-containing protein [Palleronia caenipelagi]TRD19762.1 DUF3168 domain-containing protein [Palleronia caenipelagi]
MSYALSHALQQAIYARLTSDAALTALVGHEIHDGVPAGVVPPLYVSLGDETVFDRSDVTDGGARHDFVLSVVSTEAGFATAKSVAAAISDALAGTPPTLTRGRIVGLWFLRAVARRASNNAARRIDLTFRAQVLDEI